MTGNKGWNKKKSNLILGSSFHLEGVQMLGLELRELVGSPSSEMFKPWLEETLSNLIQL